MKYSVMVMGAGFAGCRYIDALLFDKEVKLTLCGFGIKGKTSNIAAKNNLCYVDFNDLKMDNINHYDLIIVCVPLKAKYRIVQRVLIDFFYTGMLIIEKPLTLKKKELKKYNILLDGKKYYVGYARRFLKMYETFPDEDEYYISIATFTSDFRYNTNHMLPHLLEWIIRTNHGIGVVECQGDEIICMIDNKKSIIKFDVELQGIIVINDVSYKNPIFLDNISVVKTALKDEFVDSKRELEIAEKIVDVVTQVKSG